LYQEYSYVGAWNAFIIFWRIFQFFQFSPKLSAFTEILKSSKNDILYFLVILIFMLLGFGIMGNFYFGANLQQYSDLVFTIIELFKFANAVYTTDFYTYSNWAALWFISFMIIFCMMLLNMLVGILMAHYTEYEATQAMLISLSKDSEYNQRSFLQLCFMVVKKNMARGFCKRSKYNILRKWYECWKKLEHKLLFEELEL
jgi:hypothetical protein